MAVVCFAAAAAAATEIFARFKHRARKSTDRFNTRDE